jgi:hypothetical protein
MLQRYRTLAAMARLHEFTVAELAEFAGVRPTTVRTVLNREKHRVTTISLDSRTGRGGRYIRYRLNDDQLPKISADLQALEDTPQLLAKVRQVTPAAPDDEVPSALRAAEYTLLHRLPTADDLDTKRSLLDLAVASIDDATEDGKLFELGLLGRAGQAHVHAALWLRELAIAELDLAGVSGDKSAKARSLLNVLQPRLDAVLERVKEANELDLLRQIEERYDATEIVQYAPAPNADMPLVVVTPDGGAQVPRVVDEYVQMNKIACQHVALSQLSELQRVVKLFRRPAVCLLALPSENSNAIWPMVQNFLRATRGSAGDAVMSELFNARINKATTSHGVRYIVADGLEPAGVGEMLSSIAVHSDQPHPPKGCRNNQFAPGLRPPSGAISAAAYGSSASA